MRILVFVGFLKIGTNFEVGMHFVASLGLDSFK